MSNKTQTAIASLVVAVPAGVLGYFVTKSFLGGLEQLPTVFKGLYGATLAACAAMVFLPFAVVIFGPKTSKKSAADVIEQEAAPEQAPPSGESIVEESFDESEPELEEEAIGEPADVPMSTGELEIVEPTPSDPDLGAFEDFDQPAGDTEAFATDDDDFTFDDEEEPPKKKKK